MDDRSEVEEVVEHIESLQNSPGGDELEVIIEEEKTPNDNSISSPARERAANVMALADDDDIPVHLLTQIHMDPEKLRKRKHVLRRYQNSRRE